MLNFAVMPCVMMRDMKVAAPPILIETKTTACDGQVVTCDTCDRVSRTTVQSSNDQNSTLLQKIGYFVEVRNLFQAVCVFVTGMSRDFITCLLPKHPQPNET
jgi:hypothetical protein